MSCRNMIAPLILFVLLAGQTVNGQTATSSPDDKAVADQVAAAAKRLQQQQKYDLRYKLKQGETVRLKITHSASTKTQMAGFTEDLSSRMESIKTWKVSNVDSRGNMTFVITWDSFVGWEQIGDEDPISYDSKDAEAEVPEMYLGTVEYIGKPLSVLTISPKGEIVDRKSSIKESALGVGGVTVPLPQESISVGHRWAVPTIFTANDENGRSRKVKARLVYELVKVSGQNGYIKFRTELLTPNISEKVKSTIMQKMTDGYVVFDLQQGRPIKKQIEWDEKSQGFEGPDSSLTYIAKMVEELLTDQQPVNTQSQDTQSTENSTAQIRTRDDEPVVRR